MNQTIVDNSYLYDDSQSSDFKIVLDNHIILGESQTRLFLYLSVYYWGSSWGSVFTYVEISFETKNYILLNVNCSLQSSNTSFYQCFDRAFIRLNRYYIEKGSPIGAKLIPQPGKLTITLESFRN